MSSTPDPKFWGEERLARPRRDPATARGRVVDRRPSFGDGIGDRVRDLWDRWRGDPRLGLAILVAVAIIAGVVWYRVGAGGGAPARATGSSAGTAATQADSRRAPEPAPSTSDETAGDAADPSEAAGTRGGASLVVHVAGAVQHPGVVELQAGARVIDALEAAGGGLADADLDRLNLAAKLVDGQRVLVQRIGDPSLPDGTAVGDGTGTTGIPGADATTALVNLNTATGVELEELPGIGPTLAGAIITERTRRGGFRSVNELRDVRGIGEKRFADLADLVTV